MKHLFFFTAIFFIVHPTSAQEWAPVGKSSRATCSNSSIVDFPFMNHELTLDDRIYDLLDRLTLEEKIAWMNPFQPGVTRLGIPDFAFQGEALHGVCTKKATMFPQSIGLAATWDDDLIFRIASAISTEGRAKYNHHDEVNLSYWSPNINIARDPRWGRNQETYGEDPFLTSRMAVAYVKGLQGTNPQYLKVIACPKHFAVHNGPEHGKTYENRVVNELDMLETYLPAFEAIVKEAHVKGLMGAYNMLNWESCVTSKYLTDGLLRQKWGFDGYVITDCGALASASKSQKRVASPAEAVALAVKSGIDLNCGSQFEKYMKAAIDSAYMTERDVDASLYRTIKLKMQLGLFDPQEMCPYNFIGPEKIQCDAHKALSLEAAEKSITLLQNDHTLPLSKKLNSIALIGPSIKNKHVITGNYTGIPDKVVSLFEGIESEAHKKGIQLHYAKGSNLNDEPFMEWVTNEVLFTPDGKPGLKAAFYYQADFKQLVKEMVVDKVDFSYEWKAIVAEQRWNPNSVKFKGYIKPKVSGKYLLSIEGAQGVALIINGDTLAYRDRDREGRWQSYQVYQCDYEMKAGEKYKLEIQINKTQGKNNVHLKWKVPGVSPIQQAVEAARHSDVIVFAGGSSCEFEDEQTDRAFIGLSKAQNTLLTELQKTGKPIVMVLVNGSMTALTPDNLKVNAIVDAWFPGQSAGTAIANVLFGNYNPAGRTPVTFYKSLDQLPDFRDFSMHNRTYRYFGEKPLYRFGYGLSYTSFAYSKLKFKEEINTNEKLEITVDIKNTGKYDGDEVVQVYVHVKNSDMPVPISSLKAFKRVHIKKGQTQTVKFELQPEAFVSINRRYQKEIKAGEFNVFVGNCSPELRNGIAVASEKVLMKTVLLKGQNIIIN